MEEDSPFFQIPLENLLQLFLASDKDEVEVRRFLDLREVTRIDRHRIFVGRRRAEHFLDRFFQGHSCSETK